jgi:hypothetical protein
MTKPTGDEIIRFSKWLETLRMRLPMLSSAKGFAFAGSCCERLLQNYKAFSVQESWGDPDGLTKALNLIWQLADTGVSVPNSAIRETITICDSAAPDTERYTSALTSAALDAANSIAEALEFAQDGNVDHLVTISSLSRDTIDLYVQRRDSVRYDDERFEETIARDPLMAAEIQKEQRDLDVLESVQHLTPEFLASFRKEARVAGRGNLGI